MTTTTATTTRVAIFDDVLAARREVFHIPGLTITLHGDADDVQELASGDDAPDVMCMDFAMGTDHVNGEDAIRAVRAAGYTGRIVAMSSDPAANARMIAAGANESLQQKAMLRSFLVALGKERATTDKGPVEQGGGAAGLLGLIAVVALVVTGVGLSGPLGHAARYRGAFVKLHGRVTAEGAVASQIDGAPAVVETIRIFGAVYHRDMKDKKAKRPLVQLTGRETPPDAEFLLRAGGEELRVIAGRPTQWHLADGPTRRLATPGAIPAGAGLPGQKNAAYVAKSRRIVAGQHIVVVGTRDAQGRLYASAIADEDSLRALGPDFVPSPPTRAAGLGLLAAGGLLLGVLAVRRADPR